ncbi:MAG TPA: ubiquitin-activating E1 FCCH domain-containing protein [Bryobacteraceae bacterium]|jgi:hypothetical protein|nr:ubiquitin-activating E1 FCCH domain-containing protein [Bryobacteraceae bacterium]
MSTERIYKFQPDRTLALRGFTGFGAAASLCQATPSSFNVYGVFRDQADFCVLVLYDADNLYEHYTVKYLPDFNLSGMKLSFTLSYQGVQPIDSAKYSWIDWAQLDVLKTTGEPVQVRLWDHATLASSNYTVAQASCTLSAPGGCTIYDRLTLFVNNVSFDFVAGGGETAAYVAQTFANSINSYNWSTFQNNSIALLASADNSGNLTVKNARTGTVNVNGTAVSWVSGTKFPGIAPGSTIYLGSTAFTVSAVTSPTTLTLTSAAPNSTGTVYLAEYGGADGNDVAAYFVVRPGNVSLTVNNPVLQLAGGNSDNVLWNISLDFSALGIDQIRQAWFTFAPQLAPGRVYTDTQWTAAFTNWSITDPDSVSALQCAGPGSIRTGNGDTSCTYSGSGWQSVAANNYWHGFARQTANPGDSVTITYKCASTHDLYLGTSLFNNRGIASVSVDGDSATTLDCFLNVTSEVVTRRLLRSALAPGSHTVTITLLASNHQALNTSWDITSLGFQFVFDYLEAAVRSDIPPPLVTYPNVSAALDFDTDATYKVSPQRLLWHLQKLGLTGQIDEYLGVYWWNQRKRVNGTWNSAVVTFSGSWTAGDSITITIGNFPFRKAITTWDTLDTIAAHFVYYINAASVSMWAEKTGSGQITIHVRSPLWQDTYSVTWSSASGTGSASGTLAAGSDGTWEIDTSASNPINFPVAQWHADLFNTAKAAGLVVTSAFSMELVNPPDDGTSANTWKARFADGTAVDTATDFQGLFSSQCAPVANLTHFQSQAYLQLAGLQNSAGLTPWLQFGEFLWWYFSSKQNVPLGYVAYTSPISIGVASPHGFQTGDRVVISGVQGMTSANGTWIVTVTDSTHFTLNNSAANGAWVVGTGTVSGGSMAYYDPVTAAAANSALGRPLASFTCQDDDPGVNSGADATFLAGQLKSHVDQIREAVLASFPTARFELLYPDDVNHATCYVTAVNPYPQGGRLNAAVNLPAPWKQQASSGLDRLKIEALSWGATYRNLDLALQAITRTASNGFSWPLAAVAYLIPWFNGACPWQTEYRMAATLGTPLINFWAYDHLALMSWPLPFPDPGRRSLFGG